MKKIKNYIMVAAVFLTAADAMGQSTINDDVAHRRYWYYRTRFINDFIKMGKNQGECIVLAERNQGISGGVYNNTAKVGPDQIDLSNMYIATLALEYQLLSRNNQSTDETIKEIYQLLYTLNRLDLGADKVWDAYSTNNSVHHNSHGVMAPNTNTSDMNGYMMREDAYANLIQDNITDFNYEMKESGCTGNGGFTGLSHVSTLDGDSKFQRYVDDPFGTTNSGQTTIPKAAEVSLVHDKYYSMLAAFMFIVKYIPANTYYSEGGYPQSFQDGVYGIKEEAVAITNRLYPYVQGNTFTHPAPNEWIIRQPDGSTIGYTAGAMMTNYSFGASRAICHINNGYPWYWTDACTAYSDQNSQTIGLQYYSGLGGAQPTQDIAVFTAWNQAICNFPVGTFPCWLGMWANTHSANLEWAELTREVLFETHPIYSNQYSIEGPISTAPCEGPWNQSSNTYWAYYVNHDWSSQDRTEHPNSQGATSPFAGNYPGVDYMFLHNLFYEYLNQQKVAGKYDNAINLMDNEDDQGWPHYDAATNGLIGTTTNPANVHVFQNLSTRAQINSLVPSQVDYRAGKEIAFLPENGSQAGFSAQDGTELAAYISRYLCTNGDYRFGLRTTNTTSYNYETDPMNTSIALHHVEHPLSDSDLHPGPNSESMAGLQNKMVLASGSNMQVIPNPSNGIFKVVKDKRTDTEIVSLTIIDMKGTVVFEDSNFISRDLDLTNYSAGLYMVQLTSSLGYTESKKITVVK